MILLSLRKLNDEMESMLPTHTVSLSLDVRRKLVPDKSCLHKARQSSSLLEGAVSSMELFQNLGDV
jgi:hypothetical protein